MARKCSTCQHVKRSEIDRLLAAGEPANQIARDYDLNPSSLHRHRANCLGLASSNVIMKEAARGTAALSLLPSKGTLNQAYSDLLARIDQIVDQAQREGSLSAAIAGLNSLRHTLNSLARLAGHDRPSQDDSATAPAAPGIDFAAIAERLSKAFDREPEVKAKIAQALVEMDHEPAA